MIKNMVLLIFSLLFLTGANGQDNNPATSTPPNSGWFSSDTAPQPLVILPEANPALLRPGGRVTVTVFGRTKQGEHIYSIFPQGGYAPEPTLLLIKDRDLTAVDPPAQSATSLVYDEAFDRTLDVHKNDFWIQQTYEISKFSKSGTFLIPGSLTYQICSKKICSFPITSKFQVEIKVRQ